MAAPTSSPPPPTAARWLAAARPPGAPRGCRLPVPCARPARPSSARPSGRLHDRLPSPAPVRPQLSMPTSTTWEVKLDHRRPKEERIRHQVRCRSILPSAWNKKDEPEEMRGVSMSASRSAAPVAVTCSDRCRGEPAPSYAKQAGGVPMRPHERPPTRPSPAPVAVELDTSTSVKAAAAPADPKAEATKVDLLEDDDEFEIDQGLSVLLEAV